MVGSMGVLIVESVSKFVLRKGKITSAGTIAVCVTEVESFLERRDRHDDWDCTKQTDRPDYRPGKVDITLEVRLRSGCTMVVRDCTLGEFSDAYHEALGYYFQMAGNKKGFSKDGWF